MGGGKRVLRDPTWLALPTPSDLIPPGSGSSGNQSFLRCVPFKSGDWLGSVDGVTGAEPRPHPPTRLGRFRCDSTSGVRVVGRDRRRSGVGSSRVGMAGTPASGECSGSRCRGRGPGRIRAQKGLGGGPAGRGRPGRHLAVSKGPTPRFSSQVPLRSPAPPTLRRFLQTRVPLVSPWKL